MKHEIFGISTNDDTNAFEDKFEELIDLDSELYYQSQETFKHDVDDDLYFEYKYVVEIYDMDELTGEDTGDYSVSLLLVPTFESLCKEKREGVLDCTGVDEDSVTLYDVISYGISVPLGNVSVKHNGKSMDKCEGLQEKLRAIANVFESIDGLRGFYLDRYVNRIGTTGWDLLHDYVNGKDFIKATLDRYKDE